MPALSETRLRELLQPYAVLEGVQHEFPDRMIAQCSAYLDLLVRWNARTNLTAIRDVTEMATRHLGESLFAGFCLAPYLPDGARVLDLGSGAGLPGVPVQILLPGVRVTLAESQGKKAAFLREVVRALSLPAFVWDKRAELLPTDQAFSAVMLRAVDRMESMREVGRGVLRPGGFLVELVGAKDGDGRFWSIPGRSQSFVRIHGVGA